MRCANELTKLMKNAVNEITEDTWDDVSDFLCDNLFENFVLDKISTKNL
jgi:hypothetical protein